MVARKSNLSDQPQGLGATAHSQGLSYRLHYREFSSTNY